MKTTTQALTIEDIKAGYDNEAWMGWGYLGERETAALDSEVTIATIDRADALALRLANEIGMTADQFFAWLNSRPGRHYADATIHGGSDWVRIERDARRWGLVAVITD